MSENLSDFIIMRILGTNPFWMLGLNFVPNPISKVRMELSVWMETITSFNHILSTASFNYFSFQNLLSWKIIINNVKVFKLMTFINDLLINLGKILSSFSGDSSNGIISIEPSSTWTDFKTVKEVIHCGISNVQWMHQIMETVIK